MRRNLRESKIATIKKIVKINKKALYDFVCTYGYAPNDLLIDADGSDANVIFEKYIEDCVYSKNRIFLFATTCVPTVRAVKSLLGRTSKNEKNKNSTNSYSEFIENNMHCRGYVVSRDNKYLYISLISENPYYQNIINEIDDEQFELENFNEHKLGEWLMYHRISLNKLLGKYPE